MQLFDFSIAFPERAVRLATTVLVLALAVACTEGRESQSEVPAGPVMPDAELKQRVTVSGVSAGGYMAVQVHVALAHRIGGVATLAGGPYDCANGEINEALGPCMTGEGIDVAAIQGRAQAAAEAGDVGPAEAIADSRVWIFHSPADSFVDARVSDALADFYAAYVPDEKVRYIKEIDTAHGWPTLSAGGPCDERGGDFIIACDYDAAGELLNHLYPGLSDRVPGVQPSQLQAIDMDAFFPSRSGVADKGFVFVPSGCDTSSAECRLHIAFHGCKQGAEFIEDRFVTQAGLNEWAEANSIIVVYPQIESSMFNPKGCWDWWGYTGSDYANRNGRQIMGINALIDAYAGSRLIGPG